MEKLGTSRNASFCGSSFGGAPNIVGRLSNAGRLQTNRCRESDKGRCGCRRERQIAAPAGRGAARVAEPTKMAARPKVSAAPTWFLGAAPPAQRNRSNFILKK